MDFSETIEVKVVDKGDSYSVDSYFFAYFHDLQAALEQIRDAVRSSRGIPDDMTPPAVIDTTITRSPPTTPNQTDRVLFATSPDSIPKSSSSGFKLTSLLKPLQDSLPITRVLSAPEPIETNEEFTHVSRRTSASFVPITTSPKSSMRFDPTSLARPPLVSETSSSSVTPTASYLSTHTYPPSSSLSPSTSELGTSPTNASGWSVGVPSWLRMPSRRLLSSPFSSLSPKPIDHTNTMPASGSSKVSEVLSYSTLGPALSGRFSGDFGFFSILEAPKMPIDPEVVDKFRSWFAFDDKETLLGCTCCYHNHAEPICLTEVRFPGIHFPSTTRVRPPLRFNELLRLQVYGTPFESYKGWCRLFSFNVYLILTVRR